MSVKKSSPDTSYTEYLLISGVALIILLSHIMEKDAVTLLKLTISYNGTVSGTVKDIPCTTESISMENGNNSYCRKIIIEGDSLSDAQKKLLNELFPPEKLRNNPLDKSPETSGSRINSVKKTDSKRVKHLHKQNRISSDREKPGKGKESLT